MGEKTGIEYVDSTWNPWIGCTPVSEGCENCYARRIWKQLGIKPGEIRKSKTKFDMPVKLRRDGEYVLPSGTWVFPGSITDFWHPDVPHEWRHDAMLMIAHRTDLVFVIVTKRPEFALEYHEKYGFPDSGNIILMATTENQKQAGIRIPPLIELKERIDWLQIGVSAEPLLECLAITSQLDWCIIGGESGPNARPMSYYWASDLIQYCQNYSIPVFFKQWGAWKPMHQGTGYVDHNLFMQRVEKKEWGYFDHKGFHTNESSMFCSVEEMYLKVGKKKSGKTIHDREYRELPERS